MFIVETKPKSIAAESYRTLRTNLQYSSFDKEYKVIVVTSSEPGEGKINNSRKPCNVSCTRRKKSYFNRL